MVVGIWIIFFRLGWVRFKRILVLSCCIWEFIRIVCLFWMCLFKVGVIEEFWCKLLIGGGFFICWDGLWKGEECCICNGIFFGESKVGINCCWVWEGIVLGECEGGDMIGCRIGKVIGFFWIGLNLLGGVFICYVGLLKGEDCSIGDVIFLGDIIVGGIGGWIGDDGIFLGGDIIVDIGGRIVGDGVFLWGIKLEDISGCWVGYGWFLGLDVIIIGFWFKVNIDDWEFFICYDGLLNGEDCNIDDVIFLGDGKVDGIIGWWIGGEIFLVKGNGDDKGNGGCCCVGDEIFGVWVVEGWIIFFGWVWKVVVGLDGLIYCGCDFKCCKDGIGLVVICCKGNVCGICVWNFWCICCWFVWKLNL